MVLFPQGLEVLVLLESQRVDPGKVKPDLQVAEVPGMEAPQDLASGIAAEVPALQQLGISGVGPDHLLRVGHEEVVQQE